MGLDAAEKMHCKQILGIPERLPYNWPGDDPDNLLGSVPAHVETEIRDDILPAWQEVKNDTDDLDAQGLVVRPSKTRARLRSRLADLIGYVGRGSGRTRVVR